MARRKPVKSAKPRSTAKAPTTPTPDQIAQCQAIERDLAFFAPFEPVEGRLAMMGRHAHAIVAMDAAEIDAARARALKESRKRGGVATYDPTIGIRRAAHEVCERITRVRAAIGACNVEEAVWHTLLLIDSWARILIDPAIPDMETGRRRRVQLKDFSQRGNTIKHEVTASLREAIKLEATAMQERRRTKWSKIQLASRLKKTRSLPQSISTIRRWL